MPAFNLLSYMRGASSGSHLLASRRNAMHKPLFNSSQTLVRPPAPRSQDQVMCRGSKMAVRSGSPTVHPDVEEVLLTLEQIAVQVHQIGGKIAVDYAHKQPIVVGTLKGATIFMSDLVRAIDPVPDGLEMAFVRASSYGAGTQSSGKVKLGITTLADEDIVGRHLLLVEDIVDSGRTAAALTEHYQQKGAASVKMVALLSKPARREIPYEPDYLCFTIEDKFVVGFELDFAEKLRSLPYVGVLRPELYSSDSS